MSDDPITAILAAGTFAVLGASRSPEKYGSIVYRTLKQAGKTAFAVNPNADRVDGDPCYPDLDRLPTVPEAAVMVVPPAATEQAVEDCARLGIGKIWMQPGAESERAVARCAELGLTVVSGGPCLIVLLKTRGLAA